MAKPQKTDSEQIRQVRALYKRIMRDIGSPEIQELIGFSGEEINKDDVGMFFERATRKGMTKLIKEMKKAASVSKLVKKALLPIYSAMEEGAPICTRDEELLLDE